jgi:hypothetical protein
MVILISVTLQIESSDFFNGGRAIHVVLQRPNLIRILGGFRHYSDEADSSSLFIHSIL